MTVQDGLAGAVESGLITVSADALTFRHDLVRETVYAILAGNRARQLHARLAEYHLSVLGEPLVAASHARAAATTGDLASALILVSAAETLTSTSAEDAGELAALAFGTVRPAQPEWLDLSRRCLSVLCRAQHAAQAITVADQILARVDDANLAAQVETEAARALWLSGRVHDLVSRIERTLRSSDLDAAGHGPAARGVRAGPHPDATRRASCQRSGQRGRAGPRQWRPGGAHPGGAGRWRGSPQPRAPPGGLAAFP